MHTPSFTPEGRAAAERLRSAPGPSPTEQTEREVETAQGLLEQVTAQATRMLARSAAQHRQAMDRTIEAALTTNDSKTKRILVWLAGHYAHASMMYDAELQERRR